MKRDAIIPILIILLIPFVSAETSIPNFWRINENTEINIDSASTPLIEYNQAYFSLLKLEEISPSEYTATFFTKLTTPKGDYNITINNEGYTYTVIGANDEIPEITNSNNNNFTDKGIFTRITDSMDDKVLIGIFIILTILTMIIAILLISKLLPRKNG